MIAGTIVCYDKGVWDVRAPDGPPGINGKPGTSKIYSQWFKKITIIGQMFVVFNILLYWRNDG